MIPTPTSTVAEGARDSLGAYALRLPGLRTFRSPRFRLVAGACIFTITLAAYGLAIAASIDGWGTGAAFHQIMSAGRLFWEGQPTYQPMAIAPPDVVRTNAHSILYPPTHFLLLGPLIALPHAWQVAAWVALYQVALVVIVVAVYSSLGRPTPAEFLVVGALFLAAYPLRIGLENGEVELLVAALMVAAMAVHLRGREALAGILLAVAILLKPTGAVLLLLFFVWRRAGRLVAAAMGASIAVLGLTLALGWSARWQAYAALIAPVGRGTALTINQAINGLVLRYLAPASSGQPIGPLPVATEVAVDVLRLAVLGLLLWFIAGNRLPQPERSWADFSLALLALPLVQPYTLAEHWTAALVVIPLVARLATRRHLGAASTTALVVAWLAMMASSFVLFYISHHVPGPDLPAHPLAQFLSSSLLYAVVLAMVALGLGVRSRQA